MLMCARLPQLVTANENALFFGGGLKNTYILVDKSRLIVDCHFLPTKEQ